MPHLNIHFDDELPRIVGSSGNPADLAQLTASETAAACDLVEIRLDLMLETSGGITPASWAQLSGMPLLFTARRPSEGGACSLDATERTRLLEQVLDDAAVVDIEVASIPEMAALLELLRERAIPWVASCHDFDKLPDTSWLREMENLAAGAGAAVFKAAARVHTPADVARLAEFQLSPHLLPVATMGMGPLAPVSRLLCAQSGSVLNYGYLGATSTAPGQWDSGLLKTAVARLSPIRN